METALVQPTQFEQERKEFIGMSQYALELTKGVWDIDRYNMACDYLESIKKARKVWEKKFAPSLEAAKESLRNIKALFEEIDSPLEKAEYEILKPAILKFDSEQAEKRRIDQEIANRELKKQEENRRMELAAELEKSGKKEEAQAVIEAPIVAPTVVLPNSTQHKAVSYRTQYSTEVFDIKALCKGVVEGTVNPMYVMPNFPALNGLARTLKEAMDAQWQQFGVKVKSEKIIAATGGR